MLQFQLLIQLQILIKVKLLVRDFKSLTYISQNVAQSNDYVLKYIKILIIVEFVVEL